MNIEALHFVYILIPDPVLNIVYLRIADEEGACEVTLTYPDDELEKNLMAKDTVEVVTPANVSHEIIHGILNSVCKVI